MLQLKCTHEKNEDASCARPDFCLQSIIGSSLFYESNNFNNSVKSNQGPSDSWDSVAQDGNYIIFSWFIFSELNWCESQTWIRWTK